MPLYNTTLFFLVILGLAVPSFLLAESSIEEPDGTLLIQIDNRAETIPRELYTQWFHVSSSLSSNSSLSSEIENIHSCDIKKSPCILNTTLRQKMHIILKKTVTIDANILRDYVSNLRNTTRVEAKRSRFAFAPETETVSLLATGKNGSEIDEKQSIALLSNIAQDYLAHGILPEQPVLLPTVAIQTNTDINIDAFGIHTLIGEGKTNFAGSTKDRIHNIQHAMEKFNGILIAPGEEFSFVNVLGPVDGEHGYKPELVIRNNKTAPEFGGGICQVSTTMFRAAIYSGLQITARKNHSYPVRYYSPIGFDATVYVPKPDFRFINNTSGYILVQTEIIGTSLYFKFYGTDDGRKTTVDGPYVTERSDDGSLKTIFTQTVNDSQGNILIHDEFRSKYESPNKYPHPGDVLTVKPNDWSKRQWQEYTNTHPASHR